MYYARCFKTYPMPSLRNLFSRRKGPEAESARLLDDVLALEEFRSELEEYTRGLLDRVLGIAQASDGMTPELAEDLFFELNHLSTRTDNVAFRKAITALVSRLQRVKPPLENRPQPEVRLAQPVVDLRQTTTRRSNAEILLSGDTQRALAGILDRIFPSGA